MELGNEPLNIGWLLQATTAGSKITDWKTEAVFFGPEPLFWQTEIVPNRVNFLPDARVFNTEVV
jgi:hypothetical protein